MGGLIIKTSKLIDVADVFASDFRPHDDRFARRGDLGRKGNRADVDLACPWPTYRRCLIRHGCALGGRLKIAPGVMKGQKIIPERFRGETIRDRGIGGRASLCRTVKLRDGEIDGDARRPWFI